MSSDSTKCSINFAVCFFTRLLNSTASPTKGTGALWLCSLMPGFVFLPHSRTVLYEYGVVAVAFFLCELSGSYYDNDQAHLFPCRRHLQLLSPGVA
jgi:hypothetical protein